MPLILKKWIILSLSNLRAECNLRAVPSNLKVRICPKMLQFLTYLLHKQIIEMRPSQNLHYPFSVPSQRLWRIQAKKRYNQKLCTLSCFLFALFWDKSLWSFSNYGNMYRVSYKYLNDFLEMGVATKWVKPRLQIFLFVFKHTYRNFFWKFDDHNFNFSFVHCPSWSLEAINRYGVIFTFWKKNQKVIVRPCLMSQKIFLIDF